MPCEIGFLKSSHSKDIDLPGMFLPCRSFLNVIQISEDRNSPDFSFSSNFFTVLYKAALNVFARLTLYSVRYLLIAGIISLNDLADCCK